MPITIQYFFPLLLLVTSLQSRYLLPKGFYSLKMKFQFAVPIIISSTESAIGIIINITFHFFNSYNGWGGGT